MGNARKFLVSCKNVQIEYNLTIFELLFCKNYTIYSANEGLNFEKFVIITKNRVFSLIIF